MKPNALYLAAVGLVILSACSREEVVEAPRFDAKVIAAEADKGNLEPLKNLNSACSAEVENTGKRASACSAQDEVGSLRKPLKLSF